jgi:hypothetical protein
MPMPMGYEQFQPPSSNLNANNSKKIKIETWQVYLENILRRAHLNNFNINFLMGTVGGFSLSV